MTHSFKWNIIGIVASKPVFSEKIGNQVKVELLSKEDYLIKKQRFMVKADDDKEFLEFVVKALVDHPDDVKVDRKVDEMGVLLSLKVNPEDMGQIIGRAGATARAIRSLVRIVGLKNHARVNLKIEEPVGGKGSAQGEKASSEGLEDLKL